MKEPKSPSDKNQVHKINSKGTPVNPYKNFVKPALFMYRNTIKQKIQSHCLKNHHR